MERRPSRYAPRPMRWTHGTVAITVLAVSLISFFAGRASMRAESGGCPELADADPALGRLDASALEARLREGAILPPSATEKQIAALYAQSEGAEPARKTCLRRAALVRAVVSQEIAKKTTPSLWGLDHPSEALRHTFLTEKLTRDLSNEDRLDLLLQIEETKIARIAGGGAADVEHWRRRSYGLLVTCEVTDDALKRLGAARPSDCPRLAPRRPAP
ncbi:Hypothetical protein A7982_11986 [Minicystis rosea]|nr:Hypothetical protein A7982_11986 [Minicystis rosea]